MITIDNRVISDKHPPYVIAEISSNHGGSLDKAIKTICAAKESGADAVKLQTYKPSSMTLDCNEEDFIIRDGLWQGYKLFDLYNEACTPYEWHEKLFDYAKKINLTIFSTPFDNDAVDLLEKLGTPAFKIASFEIIDLSLIKYAALKGKPLLMSTGMASEREIDEAVEVAKKYGTGEIILFHCISSYPALTDDSNINLIKTLKKKYNLEIGLSDHTLDNTAAIAAVSLGATAIEKHFIMNKEIGGPDSSFSIEPKDLSTLKKDTTNSWRALGSGNFLRAPSEEKNKIFRRSLYFVTKMKSGELITNRNIKSIRPGFGLPPKFSEQIINKKRVVRDVEIGDRVEWDILK